MFLWEEDLARIVQKPQKSGPRRMIVMIRMVGVNSERGLTRLQRTRVKISQLHIVCSTIHSGRCKTITPLKAQTQHRAQCKHCALRELDRKRIPLVFTLTK